jgi:hypothetical protein
MNRSTNIFSIQGSQAVAATLDAILYSFNDSTIPTSVQPGHCRPSFNRLSQLIQAGVSGGGDMVNAAELSASARAGIKPAPTSIIV